MYKILQKIRSNKIIFAIIAVVILLICFILSLIAYPKVAGYLERKEIDEQNAEVQDEIAVIKEDNKADEEGVRRVEALAVKKSIGSVPVIIKDKAYLEVPFICQAPYQSEANWVYHEESCEEAALLQVIYFLNDTKTVKPKLANDEILDMIDWEKKNFGSHHDLYGDELKKFIMEYYGYKDDEVLVIKNAQIQDIKKQVSIGNPVIVPIMGHLLRNPYYPYPGYHMLTVIGYTPDKLITNDVGTMHGKDFSYGYDRFFKAMEAAGSEIVVIVPNKK